jgi:hypothetical protein
VPRSATSPTQSAASTALRISCSTSGTFETARQSGGVNVVDLAHLGGGRGCVGRGRVVRLALERVGAGWGGTIEATIGVRGGVVWCRAVKVRLLHGEVVVVNIAVNVVRFALQRAIRTAIGQLGGRGCGSEGLVDWMAVLEVAGVHRWGCGER